MAFMQGSTTFGLKLALWYSEMKRNIERFEHAAKGVEAGKISGAVVPLPIFHHLLKNMFANIWGSVLKRFRQVLPRDLHAEYVSAMALIATSIEKFATEIRGLQNQKHVK